MRKPTNLGTPFITGLSKGKKEARILAVARNDKVMAKALAVAFSLMTGFPTARE